jgi:hypothetical protein
MNGAFEPGNVDLFVVNYQRHEALAQTVASWTDSFPFERINVIDNHGSLEPGVFREQDRGRVRIIRSSRPDWMMGSLAECWNLAYSHALPTRDWVVCTQDDVRVRAGWAERVAESGYATYFAPKGDIAHINSIEGFGLYGWWDERFRTIHYQESDYLLRASTRRPDRLSAHDEHPWEFRLNDVGLADFWQPAERTHEILATGDWTATLYGEHLTDMWNSKWGAPPGDLLTHGVAKCLWRPEEIDWYPAVTRRLKELGRLA